MYKRQLLTCAITVLESEISEVLPQQVSTPLRLPVLQHVSVIYLAQRRYLEVEICVTSEPVNVSVVITSWVDGVTNVVMATGTLTVLQVSLTSGLSVLQPLYLQYNTIRYSFIMS